MSDARKTHHVLARLLRSKSAKPMSLRPALHPEAVRAILGAIASRKLERKTLQETFAARLTAISRERNAAGPARQRPSSRSRSKLT